MKESNFQSLVTKYLNENRIYFVNVWGGGFQSAGVPDIIVCYKGKFIALELKTTSKPTERQLFHLEKIESNGGTARVFYYSKDWKQELERILEDERYKSEFIYLPKRSVSKVEI